MSTDSPPLDPLIAREVVKRVELAIASLPLVGIRNIILDLPRRTPEAAKGRAHAARERANEMLINLNDLIAETQGLLQFDAKAVLVDAALHEINPERAKARACRNFGMSLVEYHYSLRDNNATARTIDGASFRAFLEEIQPILTVFDLTTQSHIKRGLIDGAKQIHRATRYLAKGADSPEVLASVDGVLAGADWLRLGERSRHSTIARRIYDAAAVYVESDTAALFVGEAGKVLSDIWSDALSSDGLGDDHRTLGAQLVDGDIATLVDVSAVATACCEATRGGRSVSGRGVAVNYGINT